MKGPQLKVPMEVVSMLFCKFHKMSYCLVLGVQEPMCKTIQSFRHGWCPVGSFETRFVNRHAGSQELRKTICSCTRGEIESVCTGILHSLTAEKRSGRNSKFSQKKF